MPEVFPPPKANPITVVGGLIAEFFYSWVVAISSSNNDIEARVSTLETTPTFTTPTLLNGWVFFGFDFNPAGYYKDNSGRVFLRGMIKDGTDTSGTVLFILPEGFRPENIELIGTLTDGVTFPLADPARIFVAPTGEVTIEQGNNGWISLDNLSFRVST